MEHQKEKNRIQTEQDADAATEEASRAAGTAGATAAPAELEEPALLR